MVHIESTSCCGVKEISDIANTHPKKILITTGDQYFVHADKCAFFIFTDIGPQKYGRALSKYIETNNLGKVQKSITKRNPNSESRLIIYTWAIKIREFRTWYLKQPNREETY